MSLLANRLSIPMILLLLLIGKKRGSWMHMMTQDFLEVELTHGQCHSRLALGFIIVVMCLSATANRPTWKNSSIASIKAYLKAGYCETLNPNSKIKAGLAPHKPMITQDFLEVELTHGQCHSRLALGVIIVIMCLSATADHPIWGNSSMAPIVAYLKVGHRRH